jgi:Flp pilus assembly protein TadG
MLNISYFHRFIRNDKGVAAIEFGLMVPVLFFVFFALLDLTTFISNSRKITNASAIVADLVSQNNPEVKATDLGDYFTAVTMAVPEYPTNLLKMEVYGFRKDAGGVIKKQWQYKTTTGPSCGADPATTKMADLMTSGNDIIISRVCAEYYPFFGTWRGSPILGKAKFDIREVTVTRPRTQNALNCPTCPT